MGPHRRPPRPDITDIPIKEAIATNRRLDQRFFDVIADLEAKV
jgi:ATP-dependent phosphofructokinase / diphosphate-dependent phosphofructokinase